MKKRLLKTILKEIKPYRDKAEFFLLMLEECSEEDAEFVDKLYSEFMQNIRKIESKDQLQKISKKLKEIKEKEAIEWWKDKEDVEKLEDLILNIN